MLNIKNSFIEEKIIPVIRENSFEDGLNMAHTAAEAGLNVLEITYTTPDAGKIIRKLREQYPDKIVGAGSVLTTEQANDAIESGSQFIVAPSYSKLVSKTCKEKKVIYVPGVITPSEIQLAIEDGLNFVKVFPANFVGQQYIKSITSAIKCVDIMATGGISEDNIEEWSKNTPIKVFGMGSSLFKGDKSEIKNRVEKIKRILNGK